MDALFGLVDTWMKWWTFAVLVAWWILIILWAWEMFTSWGDRQKKDEAKDKLIHRAKWMVIALFTPWIMAWVITTVTNVMWDDWQESALSEAIKWAYENVDGASPANSWSVVDG